MLDKIAEFEARLPELQAEAQTPEAMKDAGRAKRLFREIGRCEKLVSLRDRCESLAEQIADNEELAASGDEELAALAEEELPGLREELSRRREELEGILVGDDELGDRNAMIELRAGTGGDEAALFARDLSRIYARYSERMGWKMKPVSMSESELGGYKEAVFSVEGEDVFRVLRFESGGHRVQRVPVTESQGRVHTSAATVAVLPQVEELEVRIDDQDLEIQTTTSSGPGGQHVNKTESAVRITHRPSGLVVFCQEERSQHKNKAKALKLLRSRLFDHEQQQRQKERAEVRKSQIGSGDRSQRIRTYNYPQNRCTDHRTGQNYSLEKISDGDLGPVHEDLLRLEKDEKLRDL
ncbi:MAG: peptide chain release factor 1 [Planctomycetota bacterium]|nr:MAG: peptide chain release factor 1 [Planctomycetota bacterium]